MDPLAFLLLAPLAVLTLAALAIRARTPRPRRPRGLDYEAMAQIEEHDIEQMLDGINERRRRSGRRRLDEELADEAMRATWR
jgi:hypothetical protein